MTDQPEPSDVPVAPENPEPAASIPILRRPPRTPTPEPLIPDILPAGQVHLLSGASGTGKTVLYLQLLKTALTGEPFLGLQLRRPRFIGIIASDRPGEDHRKWMDLVGIAEEVAFYSLVDDQELSQQQLHAHLDERSNRGGRMALFKDIAVKNLVHQAGFSAPPYDSLIVVDPIALFLSGNLNDYQGVFTHMFGLNQFCTAFGCTILGIAHAGKQTRDRRMQYTRPQDRILGSTAQTSCAGTTLHLAPPEETGKNWYELTMVPHHAPSASVGLLRAQDGAFVPASESQPTLGEQKRALGAYQLRDVFPEDGTPITTAEILTRAEAAFGKSQPTIKRWLREGADLHFWHPVSHGTWALSKPSVN